MAKIHPWLILGTASLLRRPKSLIVFSILAVFLLAYDAVYDFSLRPLNGKLVSHFNNFTLHDGTTLQSTLFLSSADLPGDNSLGVAKLSFEAPNTLRYPYLCDLVEFQNALLNSTDYILSPVSMWPIPLAVENPTANDIDKAEKYVLKLLNLDHNTQLIRLFLDRLSKKNHLIHLAGKLHIYAFYNKLAGVPDFSPLPDTLHLLGTTLGRLNTLVKDLKTYYRYVRGELPFLNLMAKVWSAFQLLILVAILLHVYLSICNQHKIRSSVGLMIGWFTEVSMSALASLCIISHFKDSSWCEVFGPLGERGMASYFIVTVVLSSRNLFRTIHDLAGDNAFGAPENLHKRLIKYYLGINSSVSNSQGVYRVIRLLRRLLMLDKLSASYFPVPNTTVILLINLVGITLVFGSLRLIALSFLRDAHLEMFSNCLATFLLAILISLVVDHFLQLTFLVGIVVIDLNRVDLIDFLNKSSSDDSNDVTSTIHEVNPISTFLLGLHGKPAPPNSLRCRLGTYCLKISPVSTRRFWTTWIPPLLLSPIIFKILLLKLTIADELAADPTRPVPLVAEKLRTQTYDSLFYAELFAIVVFVIAISQLTFTLTYSKRQRKLVDLDEITALISSDSGLTNVELLTGDEIKFFECITLAGAHRSDILKLESNSKCSFLVSTDLDHKVLVWSPLSKTERNTPLGISTFFESANGDAEVQKAEFWPINHIVISDDGNYIVLINNKNCRIKCFDRKSLTYVWEVSLTSELTLSKKMQPVTAFFRKRTVAGFIARKLMLQKKARRRNSATSILSATTITGNYPPPMISENRRSGKDNADRAGEIEDSLHREEFVIVLESGEMATIACDDLKIKVYNPLSQLFEGQKQLLGLKIISLKQLKTARVNDRIVCNLSNDDIVVGTAVNNLWRFNKLDIDVFFSVQPPINFAPPLMSRTGSAISVNNDFLGGFELQRQNYNDRPENGNSVLFDTKKYPPINQSAIITIDFVGMVVRVKDLQAQLVDIQTGTIVKVFDIGHFKPGTFRVVHSEPTHCKFCGCASFESITLVYQDFYEKMLILQTFTVENKKSRNNICLRVERDPREIRCVGFDSVIESNFWYDNIEMWEVTDMNVIVGIRKNDIPSEDVSSPTADTAFSLLPANGFSSFRSRKQGKKPVLKEQPEINDLWQGFVITAQNGKLLEYNLPKVVQEESEFACTRPNCIVKYGYKSVAIAFGRLIKIIFLGGEKLIEHDLYYSGTTSTLNGILKPNKDGVATSNELLFINKRRRMLEKRIKT